MRIGRFEDVEAWQLARELTRKVYNLTRKPEFARDFSLKEQIQDAAGSSMHNIAEGFDSETNPEFQDVYDHAARTRAAIRGSIKYLVFYERDQRNKSNPER